MHAGAERAEPNLGLRQLRFRDQLSPLFRQKPCRAAVSFRAPRFRCRDHHDLPNKAQRCDRTLDEIEDKLQCLLA